MKYFIYEIDGSFECIYTLKELEQKHPAIYKKYMCDNFNSGEDIIVYDYEYKGFYEYETDLTIEQLYKVIDHDFIYNEIEILRTLGTLKKII